MRELTSPIIGITLVLMSVFIPAGFMPGITGQMYSQFALVIAAISWHRWRGLWLLVSVPLLVYWPFAFWLLVRACAQNINACP